jgi:hypothetical protein
MERLTARTEKGHAYLVNVKPDEQEVDSPHKNTLQCILDCFERLAAYEDTGLTPEETEDIAKAKADGRLVVLPCKIGTKVYFISQDCEMCRSLQKDEPCLFGDCPYRGITETIFTYGAIGQFGKTVFLTREEAEAALRKEQSDER